MKSSNLRNFSAWLTVIWEITNQLKLKLPHLEQPPQREESVQVEEWTSYPCIC